jgi:hypothetical protein
MKMDEHGRLATHGNLRKEHTEVTSVVEKNKR